MNQNHVLAPDHIGDRRGIGKNRMQRFARDRHPDEFAAALRKLMFEPSAFACNQGADAVRHERAGNIERGAFGAARTETGYDLKYSGSGIWCVIAHALTVGVLS